MKFNLYILAIAAFSIAFAFYFCNQNPYDIGDSITHYAISKYSWKHHELFLDHWGKPVFTILSSPFSQFGFNGVAVFNTLIGVFTVIIVALIIQKWNSHVSPYFSLLLFFVPDYILVLHSGLTEPLYGLIVVGAFYLILTRKYSWAMVCLSFLPYVRSEGFITMSVAIAYLFLIKEYKSILFGVIGTIVLSITGAVFFGEGLLWVFNKTPYIVPNDFYPNYGSGNFTDYFVKYYYLTGIPFTILFYLSVGLVIYTWFKVKDKFSAENLIPVLLLALFFSYFFAHVVFWTFGIFKSFGMSRVMLSIVPIGYVLILFAWSKVEWNKYVQWAIVIVFIVFPFTGNKSGFNYKEDFSKPEEMINIESLANKIPSTDSAYVYYTSMPMMILMGLDIYDTQKYGSINPANIDKIDTADNYYIFTDDWFRVVDLKIEYSHPIFKKSILMDSYKVSDDNTLRIFKSPRK